jgi:zinc protease
VILAGQRWLPRHHPDRYASDLLNYILGGGVFQSRLGEAIRSDRGLAYSVSSGVRRLHEDQGYLYVFAGTKPESQGEVLALVHSVTDAMRAKADISAEELSRTKEAFLNRHIFNFDTAYGLAVQQAVLEHYGYDPDWLRTYPERIAAVTAADLARLANERLRPDQFATVLVTPKAPTEGDWTPIDLSEAVR